MEVIFNCDIFNLLSCLPVLFLELQHSGENYKYTSAIRYNFSCLSVVFLAVRYPYSQFGIFFRGEGGGGGGHDAS